MKHKPLGQFLEEQPLVLRNGELAPTFKGMVRSAVEKWVEQKIQEVLDNEPYPDVRLLVELKEDCKK